MVTVTAEKLGLLMSAPLQDAAMEGWGGEGFYTLPSDSSQSLLSAIASQLDVIPPQLHGDVGRY